ncbi:MAG: glutamate--tRNA ligase [bacterium]|nr:MAG: glutamate--tRNA ligase [bacterium]
MRGIRVRFAPSPTGYLHVGGARTALFNWLFARHESGTFILRIEDTDVDRSSEDLERQMIEDLTWLGLEWDEGPGREGDSGPYRQSERLSLYRGFADRLVTEGKAYFCFCTDDELEQKRERMLREGKPPHYDGTCRRLGESQREERRSEGRPESIRFIVQGGDEHRLDDLVRGEVIFRPGMVGDFVLIRSNGLPTYNFAAAVDDATMGITHVIRGEEHLSNTLRQMMIYEVLDFELPLFAHIPLILGPDRSKLSKRHGAPNIRDFHRLGYPAEALVNYLAFLGWSPPDGREILTIAELIAGFTLERVSKAPGIFDEAKLNWVSAQHIRAGGSKRYFEQTLPYIPDELRAHYSEEALAEIFAIVSENLACFSRVADELAPFYPGPPELSGEILDLVRGNGALFDLLIERLGAVSEWNTGEIKKAVNGAGKELQVKGKALYMPIRAAVTGLTHGPDLVSILRIRGREDILASLSTAGCRET